MPFDIDSKKMLRTKVVKGVKNVVGDAGFEVIKKIIRGNE